MAAIADVILGVVEEFAVARLYARPHQCRKTRMSPRLGDVPGGGEIGGHGLGRVERGVEPLISSVVEQVDAAGLTADPGAPVGQLVVADGMTPASLASIPCGVAAILVSAFSNRDRERRIPKRRDRIAHLFGANTAPASPTLPPNSTYFAVGVDIWRSWRLPGRQAAIRQACHKHKASAEIGRSIPKLGALPPGTSAVEPAKSQLSNGPRLAERRRRNGLR